MMSRIDPGIGKGEITVPAVGDGPVEEVVEVFVLHQVVEGRLD